VWGCVGCGGGWVYYAASLARRPRKCAAGQV
jgi:hypothetical protein